MVLFESDFREDTVRTKIKTNVKEKKANQFLLMTMLRFMANWKIRFWLILQHLKVHFLMIVVLV